MAENLENTDLPAAAANHDGRLARGSRTRQALLDAAFFEIYDHGFRSASLNEIIRKAGCTKGSLYHHFPDKHALGLAAVAEHTDAHIGQTWIEPLARTNDPLTSVRLIILRYANETLGIDPLRGCPFQNLTQEMSGLDEDFQSYFATLFGRWRGAIAAALAKGQANGTVRKDIDPECVATLVVASHQGVVSMIKATQDKNVGHAAATAFFDYLESLRP